MGMYDQSARFATAAEPGFVLVRLLPLTGLNLEFRRWLDTKGLPLPGGPDREADLIALADDSGDEKRPWLLIFEFQSQHDPGKAKVLQLEAMIFLCHARDTDRDGGELLPLPVFVYLKGECPESTVSVRTPTGRGFTGEPVVWEVARDSAADALAKVESGELSWGAMFWISLMEGAEGEDVVNHWRRLRDDKVPEKRRADVSFVAAQLAELAGCRIAWERVKEGVKMTESAIANEMIELGRMSEAREALLRLIRLRFPTALTPDVEQAIADQPNLALMKTWLDAAFTVTTAEEFIAVLRR